MPADEPGSVTRWLKDLKDGDPVAARPLWERYFGRLVRLAHGKLQRARHAGDADGEDVALSAFDSFCRAARDGRFPKLDDRDDLWRLLVALTAHKASDEVRRARSRKRGGGAVRAEADLGDGAGDDAGLDGLPGPGPSPEFAAMV